MPFWTCWLLEVVAVSGRQVCPKLAFAGLRRDRRRFASVSPERPLKTALFRPISLLKTPPPRPRKVGSRMPPPVRTGPSKTCLFQPNGGSLRRPSAIPEGSTDGCFFEPVDGPSKACLFQPSHGCSRRRPPANPEGSPNGCLFEPVEGPSKACLVTDLQGDQWEAIPRGDRLASGSVASPDP